MRQLARQVWQPRGRRFGRSLAFILLCLGMLLASISTAAAYPAWQRDTLYVQDFTGLLAADTVTALNADGLRLYAATGAQVVIAVVPDTDGQTVPAYATGLYRDWGIGDKEKNNGALLLIVPAARQVRIEVGYGLEGALNDAKAGAILDRDFVPAARDGDLDTAAIRTYRALCTEIAHDAGLDTAAMYGTDPIEPRTWTDDPLTTAFIAGVILLMLYRSRHGTRRPHGTRDEAGDPGRDTSDDERGGGGFGGGSSGGGGAGRGW